MRLDILDRSFRARFRAGLSAIALVVVALWLEKSLPAGAVSLSLGPLSLAVALSAWLGGLRTGLAALAASLVGIDYYVLDPGTFFTLGGPPDLARMGLYAGGWGLFCGLADRVYRRAESAAAARIEAERLARQSDRLAELTAGLGQARTPSAAIEATLQEPLHALEADAGMLLLVHADSQSAEIARAVAYASAPAEWPPVPLDRKCPIGDAVGRGAPVICESRARWRREYPDLPVDLYPDEYESMVAVPLLIGSRVVAVVKLDFRESRRFTADDREYVFSVGPRAAQALDRTWQYESAQRARLDAESLRERADQELAERQKIERALRVSEGQFRALAARTSRMHDLTAALSEAVTLDAVARAVVRQGTVAVGATTGDVMLLVDNGTTLETLYADRELPADDSGRRTPVESGFCSTEAVRTGRPVFVGSFPELQERYWRSASSAADGGYVSSATLPLNLEGRVIGVVAFYFTVPVNFDAHYQALLISVAQHCAQALDRARLYESAQRARAEAEAANRLKDEFVSIVSHELRTPLNAILGWTSMLQRGTLEPLVAGRALQSVHDNATRQARLIDELLDFSRIMSGRTKLDLDVIDMRELIRGVAESMIPSAAARGIELRLTPVPPVSVPGDARRLEQVFFNLLSNALKFTPAGGRIELETRLDDPMVEIRVADTGIGIEPEFLPHVFDRFRQADSATTRSHGGLGLGLSIARQLVEAHDGTIGVESPGRDGGATFVVRLPLAAEAAVHRPGPQSVEASAEMPRLDGIHILVVEDEPDTREIMAHALRGCGAEVTLAATARDALGLLEREPMDVLLADIAMPGEDGYSLIRKVRANAGRIAAIPAAAVTAHAREEERRAALDAGFQVHVAKPFEPLQLVRAVETLVRGTYAVH
ncbi:MAG TPA: ATP-binding protein [Vicinamibacterales bacterium]|nr:ATP-binding protein [Vicinamibacterales bacterium]